MRSSMRSMLFVKALLKPAPPGRGYSFSAARLRPRGSGHIY